MKLLLLVLLTSSHLFAAVETSTQSITSETKSEKLPISFEASVLAQSVVDSSSPLVGSAAIYDFKNNWNVGARALMSLINETGESTSYAMQVLSRYDLYKSETILFTEASVALNYEAPAFSNQEGENFESFGVALGVKRIISSGFSVGGFSGFEVSSEGFYPKISAFVSLNL